MKIYGSIRDAWGLLKSYGPAALLVTSQACNSIEVRNGVEKRSDYTEFPGSIVVYTCRDTSFLSDGTYMVTARQFVDTGPDGLLDLKGVSAYAGGNGKPCIIDAPVAVPTECVMDMVPAKVEMMDTAFFMDPPGRPSSPAERSGWQPGGTEVRYAHAGSPKAAALQQEFQSVKALYGE
jgi:hypothetical protein